MAELTSVARPGSAVQTSPLAAAGMVVQLAGRRLGPFDVLLAPGELVALVGDNGSGKSTCIRAALGLYRLSDGQSAIFGKPVSPSEPPIGVGYVPDKPVFWDWCSGSLNASAFAVNATIVQELLVTFGLAAAAERPARRYSRGMRQRLAIVRALAAEPRLLVMDEPTIALDAEGTDILTTVLAERRRVGLATLIASHDAAFIAHLQPRIILVADGKIVS